MVSLYAIFLTNIYLAADILQQNSLKHARNRVKRIQVFQRCEKSKWFRFLVYRVFLAFN